MRDIYDSWAENAELKHEYGLKVSRDLKPRIYGGAVVAVAHKEFRELEAEGCSRPRSSNGWCIWPHRLGRVTCSKRRMPYIQSNVTGTLNVLEGCRHNGVEHLVYASTSSVYGANTNMPFSVHSIADHPLSLYATTKRANGTGRTWLCSCGARVPRSA